MATDPFPFFALRVLRTRRIAPSMLRITFGGEDLKGFESGGYDQSLSLFLPHPHQSVPVVPVEEGENWFAAWRALPEEERAVRRSYTVREQRRAPDEIDIDFALHEGSVGPATRWALGASPGDRITVQGPALADNAGVMFRLPPEASGVILFADQTALPALAAILERLPAGIRARAWIEAAGTEDLIALPTPADAEITWIIRDGAGAERADRVLEEVRAYAPPHPGSPYAWIAGESGTVRALRRHLVGERGLDRRAVTFCGYWRLGLSEEQLLGAAPDGDDGEDSDD
ncbi:siderophore-interacting protein [Streptomyces sp. 5.8]|uniref:siderophore-interacting protein n=1 Tax=Streptomyces sp. 5.8 TaxID=3406571 RepID=UPI003BB605A6